MNKFNKLSGPFEIFRIIEFEGSFREPEHLIPSATEKAFKNTQSFQDTRFYDPYSKKLIMSFHGILIKTSKSIILVDTCIGNNKHRPAIPEWHMRKGTFLEEINHTGIKLEDIDYVLCTHLHADHVGWNTKLLDGRWIPTFPNATYLFGKEEIDFWEKDKTANHNSWNDSIEPILVSGQAQIVESNHHIEPGVDLVPAFGHSPGHVMLKLNDGNSIAYVIGDVIHHPVQIEHPDWSSMFCWDEAKAASMRSSILSEVANKNHLLIPAHFPSPTAVKIKSFESGFWIDE